MAEHIGERSSSDEGQIFVGKSQTGFLPVNHVCHLINTTPGFTSLGLSYLSTPSATVRRLSRLSPALPCFPCLPLRQRSAPLASPQGFWPIRYDRLSHPQPLFRGYSALGYGVTWKLLMVPVGLRAAPADRNLLLTLHHRYDTSCNL
jgi:hypothetical protein